MKQTAQVAGIKLNDTLRRALFALLAAALVLFVLQQIGSAQAAEKVGKDVVTESCASCHASGANGAPKIGDKQAWAKLAERGLASLTADALAGVRKMPPHGANMKLSNTEIQRAITYMVNQSGGNWVEPTSTKAAPAERTGEQVVQMRCAQCHEKGLHGAPKIGDADAWIPRVKDGLDVVVRSAINGHGGMQARGGMANLTDNEMRNAIIYMMNRGRVNEKDLKK